ncbi:MAG: cupin domain-containing protein [Bacteroidota bacterium]
MDYLGRRLRQLRQSKKFTLQQLAETTGLTASFISQVERNQTMPSVLAIQKISKALGTSVTYFFEESISESKIIVRKDQRKKLTIPGGKIHYELLTPSLGKEMEFLLAKMEPGIETEDPFPHEGEEYGYVVSGNIKMLIGDQFYDLSAGDSVCFKADLPHAIHNLGNEEAVMIWARINTGSEGRKS